MKETFIPKQNYAKAFGVNMRISTKSAQTISAVIRDKPLTRARRLLEDLKAGRRNLEGKYYTKTVKAIIELLNSCEKNAEFKNLDADRLFVHASAHKGTNMRRRRRKGAFGTKLKSTNMELLLIERGKERKDKVPKKKIKTISRIFPKALKTARFERLSAQNSSDGPAPSASKLSRRAWLTLSTRWPL